MFCSTLNEIQIPESITEIEEKTFSGCSSLQKVVILYSLKVIKENAFGYVHH